MVKTLAASRRARRADAAAASCSEVITVAVQLTNQVIDFPSSPDILVYSATIIASSSVVCTDAEKASLAAVIAAFEEALATLDSAVETAQSQLETLTGATASPEEIAEVLAATTTKDTSTTTTAAVVTGACEGLYNDKHVSVYLLNIRNITDGR